MKSYFILSLFVVSAVFAQADLVGHWSFDDPAHRLKATVGNDLVLVGSHSPALDPDQKDGAIRIGVGSYYILPHGIPANGGGSRVNLYTLVVDFKIPQSGVWHTIYQTDPTNQSDGEVFINPSGAVGVGATGYTEPLVEQDKWYRLAVVAENGVAISYYLDGLLALKGSPGSVDGRHSLGTTLLLFADENGEDNDIIVSDIKLFSRALTKSEIKELGGFGNAKIQEPEADLVPYLQTPTPNSIYVCWHESDPSGSYVRYGRTGSLNETVFATSHQFDTDYFWCWAKLTGLEPATVYNYQIVTAGGASDTLQFKTAPLPGQNSGHVRFGVVGDNRTEPDVFKRTMDKMKEKIIETYGDSIVDSMNLVLNVGDIVTNGYVLSQYAREYFAPVAGLSATVPSMVSIGNHEAEAPIYYDYMKYEDIGGPQGEKYYSFQYGRVLFVAINSNSGLRNETQLTWLDTLLSNAQQDSTIDWIITFCHHPGHSEIWPDGNTGYIQNSVIPLLNKYSKVDILMYGHSHNYERGTVADGNVRLMLNGGAGSALDRWRMYGNQRNYPEIQKSFDYYCYSIFDIDIEKKRMEVKSYSLGHTDKYMENVLFDEFYRDKSNETPPERPTAVAPENDTIVDTHVELQASPYAGTHELMSSQFQVSAVENDFSSPYFDALRDFEDIYFDTGAPDYLPIDLNQGIDLSTVSFELENVKPGSRFWWRVRYRDKNLQWSDWSETSSFVTRDRQHNQEPNDTWETATKMFTSDTLRAEFSSGDDVDWYQFYLSKLTIYYLASFDSQTGVEPDIELYHESNLNQNLLPVSVQGLNDGGDFLLAGYMPLKEGTFFAKVTNKGDQTGSYKIRLSGGRPVGDMVAFEYDNTPASLAGRDFMPVGDTLKAALFPVDDVDYFKIQGQKGDQYEIGTLPIYDLDIRDTDTFISLLDETATVLNENDNRGPDSTADNVRTNTFSVMNGLFPATGTYYLRVQNRYRTQNGQVNVAHSGIGEYGVYFHSSPGTGVGDRVAAVPEHWAIHQNYPNPFNPSTRIRFDVPYTGIVNLVVYDTAGRTIKRLAASRYPAGSHTITWDGTNDSGNRVATGLYFCRITGDKFDRTIKMMLIH